MKILRFAHNPFHPVKVNRDTFEEYRSKKWANNWELLDVASQKVVAYGNMEEGSEWAYSHVVVGGTHYMANIRVKNLFDVNTDNIINATIENYELQQEIYRQSEDWRDENEGIWEEMAL